MNKLIKSLETLIQNALSLSAERKTHLLSLLPTLSEGQLKHLQSILELEKTFLGAAIQEKLKTPEGKKAFQAFTLTLDKVIKKALTEKERSNKAEELTILQDLEQEIHNL